MEPERLTIQEQMDLLQAWVEANSDDQLPADGTEPDRPDLLAVAAYLDRGPAVFDALEGAGEEVTPNGTP